jgi:aminoglycoside 3-N-acetyltransferase
MGLEIRKFKGWLKSVVPAALKERIKRRMRSQRLKGIRDLEVPITLAEFEQALRKLGVDAGQVLFVHSGADWLRSVEGGPIKVLELIRRILGDEGTLALPSFPFDGLASEYLATGTFDVRRSPSKMGLLTELFRRMPGVRRSLHATHPVCAIGKMSEHLTNSHHLDSHPFGPRSPFGRLEEGRGMILMLGVNSDFLTHVHVVEDEIGDGFPLQVYLPDPIEVSVVNQDGNTVSLTTLVHNPAVSRLKSISRHEREWQRSRVLRRSTVGHIELRLIDAKRLSEHLHDQARQGRSIYE